MKEEKKICGAQLKGHPDKFCHRAPLKGKTRCRKHGGRSLSGIAHPNFKTGEYCKSMPARLSERYEQFLRDPQMLSLVSEIPLIDSRLVDLLSRLTVGDSAARRTEQLSLFNQLRNAVQAPEQDQVCVNDLLDSLGSLLESTAEDDKIWKAIHGEINHRRKLVESERRRLVQEQKVVTLNELMAFMRAVAETIKAHVLDATTLRKIQEDLDRIYHRSDTPSGYVM